MKFVARLVALVALTAALAGPPAAAQSDPWSLRQNTESCYIARTFTVGNRTLDLTIQSFGPDTPVHFILSGPGLPLLKQRAQVAKIGFGGIADAHSMVALFGSAGTTPMIVFAEALGPVRVNGRFVTGTPNVPLWQGVDPAAKQLYFEAPGMEPLTLQIGPMEPEYARLDACAQALADKWSAAASAGAKPVTAPKPTDQSETNWHLKFPAALLLNRISALVEVRMTIDDKGRAHDCVVQRSTWDLQYGTIACSAYQNNTRFEPARDAQGNAVPGFYNTAAIFIVLNT